MPPLRGSTVLPFLDVGQDSKANDSVRLNYILGLTGGTKRDKAGSSSLLIQNCKLNSYIPNTPQTAQGMHGMPGLCQGHCLMLWEENKLCEWNPCDGFSQPTTSSRWLKSAFSAPNKGSNLLTG